ncbi:hypothetical protein [Peribacillus aracenensis]|uniref:hypothetical protein n=1 Tax=Peribacillus aracenensis TaxID=2976708 RepID=UPI0021A70C3A|nr:hypothetical protein [Peribacillus sp. BBB004]
MGIRKKSINPYSGYLLAGKSIQMNLIIRLNGSINCCSVFSLQHYFCTRLCTGAEFTDYFDVLSWTYSSFHPSVIFHTGQGEVTVWWKPPYLYKKRPGRGRPSSNHNQQGYAKG